jgi:A/G-specific adenine glycosylase
VAFAVQHRGQWLVRQRPAGQINAHLWEFPNVELTDDNGFRPEELAQGLLRFTVADLRKLCTVRHTITRYRMTLEVFAGKVDGRRKPRQTGKWLSMDDIRALPFPSAHKRVREQLISELSRPTG